MRRISPFSRLATIYSENCFHHHFMFRSTAAVAHTTSGRKFPKKVIYFSSVSVVFSIFSVLSLPFFLPAITFSSFLCSFRSKNVMQLCAENSFPSLFLWFTNRYHQRNIGSSVTRKLDNFTSHVVIFGWRRQNSMKN
jgi:hypothetical protein